MRAIFLCVVATLAAASTALAQVEGHRILFADSTTISDDDQRAIFGLLEYTVSADGTVLEAVDCGPIYVTEARDVDLNEDGTAEFIVIAGNACTSGMAGSSVVLFVKDAEGHYGTHLGFPAGAWRKLETSNLGFPDLAFGGPGFCESVWRWDGSTYQHHRNEPTEPGGCDEVG
jgi:hypothetical protein